MMISPATFKMENEGKNLKQLICVRNDLLVDIKDYELKKIFNDKPLFTEDDMIKPSPRTRYIMNMRYLKEIIDLILEKQEQSEYGEIIFDNSQLENNLKNNNANNLLKRKQLISLIYSFKNKLNAYAVNKSSASIDLYLDFLNEIEEEIKKHDFEIDDRFVNAYNDNHGWISPQDAIDCLFDNIEGNVIINPVFANINGKSLSDLQINQDDYYKDGIVCNLEKDMLLKQIIAIKNYLLSKK